MARSKQRQKPRFRVNDMLLSVNLENVNHVINRIPENNYILEVMADDSKDFIPIGIFSNVMQLRYAMDRYMSGYLGIELEGDFDSIMEQLKVIEG